MDRFTLEPRAQRVWDKSHATWFTLMAIGGALFFLARLIDVDEQLGVFLGLPVVDLISFLAIAVGGLILILDLGRPIQVFRALVHVRTSWISRGAIADIVFLVVGGLLIIPNLRVGQTEPFAWLPWSAEATTGAGRALELVGMLAAVVVAFYAGAVLAKPKAIPYWNSPYIVLQFLCSSFVMAMAIIVALEAIEGEPISSGQLWLLVGLLVLLAALIVGHLSVRRETPGKIESIAALVRGEYSVAFLGGVLVAGTVVPAILVAIAAGVGETRDVVAVVASVATVAAGFWLRLLTLRVGIFPPVRTPLPVVSKGWH